MRFAPDSPRWDGREHSYEPDSRRFRPDADCHAALVFANPPLPGWQKRRQLRSQDLPQWRSGPTEPIPTTNPYRPRAGLTAAAPYEEI
jgi:hypothetical protein